MQSFSNSQAKLNDTRSGRHIRDGRKHYELHPISPYHTLPRADFQVLNKELALLIVCSSNCFRNAQVGRLQDTPLAGHFPNSPH
jgi:hypothetical protein